MKVAVNIRVIFQTPFNVGSGALADSLADKPTIKDVAHLPVLPGSSFKGRARHECERIVRALTEKEWSVCHGPVADNMCPLDPVRLQRQIEQPCPVCSIFGSPWLPGAIHFPDLQWEFRDELESERPPDTTIRPGVSIGRARKVAEGDKLFTIETFAPTQETAFTGRISGDLPDDSQERYGQIGLLVVGLRAITSLGGGRSRGLGRCLVKARPMEIQDGTETAVDDGTLKEGLAQWFHLK